MKNLTLGLVVILCLLSTARKNCNHCIKTPSSTKVPCIREVIPILLLYNYIS